MATQTITDPGNANAPEASNKSAPYATLASWIMELVRNARQSRDTNYKGMWDSFERVYRGHYSTKEKSRDGERSRLIAPALQQAIDSTSAAIEDAIFGRSQWFDISDDVADEDKKDIAAVRDRLLEDMDLAGVPEAISKTVLNGCLYGTGIGKINIIRKELTKVTMGRTGPEEKREMRPLVTLTAVAPWEFVIDTNARNVDDAFFCAHEFLHPKHKVWEGQRTGRYRKDVSVNSFHSSSAIPSPGGLAVAPDSGTTNEDDGAVWITEYCGKVPAKFVKNLEGFDKTRVDAGGNVEVIATIANEQDVLRIRPNPYMGQDRPFVAYQHCTVPGRFYGDGVAAKGWNAQKALDAELRARMDALGLITSPMMGADITRLPRNPDMKVRPGKVWMTRGRPSEVLEPVILGNINPQTFNQSAEMERLVQVGTGAIDSNAPLDNNRRNETASGISMIQSSALKRMRRTMWNMERQFLNPFMRKAIWRYMQFNPQRYPSDYIFEVRGTMGIVAREFEQSNLTALLSVVSPDHPSYGAILQGVIELSGSPKRDALLAAMEKAAQPNPEQQKMQQMMQQLQLRAAVAEVDKSEAERDKLRAEVLLTQEKARHERIVADLEDEKIELQAANAVIGREKARATFEQNEIARQRNKIDEIKVRNTGKSKGD